MSVCACVCVCVRACVSVCVCYCERCVGLEATVNVSGWSITQVDEWVRE